MNNSSGQSYALPIPIPYWNQTEKATVNLLENDAPARVKVALEFLHQLTLKTMPKAAATDHNIEWADKTELSANEKAAQGAACNLLIQYFAGDLKPDGWEAIRKRAAVGKVIPSNKPGMLLRCFIETERKLKELGYQEKALSWLNEIIGG